MEAALNVQSSVLIKCGFGNPGPPRVCCSLVAPKLPKYQPQIAQTAFGTLDAPLNLNFKNRLSIFCVVYTSQLPNNGLSAKLIKTRESMSPVSSKIFERDFRKKIQFRGHLSPRNLKIEGVRKVPYSGQPGQRTHCREIGLTGQYVSLHVQ